MKGARTRPAMLYGMLTISTVGHVLAYVALLALPQRQVSAPPALEIETIELRDPPPTPPAPAPIAAAAPAAVPDPPPRARRVVPPRPASPPPPRPAPATPEAIDPPPPLTTDAPSTWSLPAQPAQPPPSTPPASTSSAPATTAPIGNANGVVPLGTLARRPGSPGGLDTLLQRHYPRRARARGIAGRVVVRMRVAADGRASNVRVLTEAPAGFEFASACREMLGRAPPFLPGLDRQGRAVPTEIAFTCTFEVGDE